MKRPYKLGLLALSILTISSLVLCILSFPNWITSLATCMAGFVYILYLASKDEPLTNIEDLDEKIIMVCLWLSLVLVYPIIIYSAWKDRDEIRKRIKNA